MTMAWPFIERLFVMMLVMASSDEYIQQLVASDVIPIFAAASKKRLVEEFLVRCIYEMLNVLLIWDSFLSQMNEEIVK